MKPSCDAMGRVGRSVGSSVQSDDVLLTSQPMRCDAMRCNGWVPRSVPGRLRDTTTTQHKHKHQCLFAVYTVSAVASRGWLPEVVD